MIKSLMILVIALFACGVEAHETTDSTDRLHQLLTEDNCSYCEEQRASDREQRIRQIQMNRRLQRIEENQVWESMKRNTDRALGR